MNATRNLWPLGIILAFALFISGTIGLIVMASSQKVDLVSDHYYEQEIKYQNQIENIARAQRLGSRASIMFDAASRRLRISLPPEHTLAGLAGRIRLYRPSSARCDQELDLAPDPNGMQTVQLDSLLPGLWKVIVSWNSSGQFYLLEQRITNSVVAPGVISKP